MVEDGILYRNKVGDPHGCPQIHSEESRVESWWLFWEESLESSEANVIKVFRTEIPRRKRDGQ